MFNNVSVQDFVKQTNLGAIPDVWYDWFCSDYALKAKTKKLATKVLGISSSPKVNKDSMYVWFKNNCPCYGNHELYDDFRISDIKTGDVVFTVTPRDPFGKATVHGRSNGFKEPLVEGSWDDVVAWFNS